MEEALMSDPPSPASALCNGTTCGVGRRRSSILMRALYALNATKAANRVHQLIMRVYTVFIRLAVSLQCRAAAALRQVYQAIMRAIHLSLIAAMTEGLPS